MDSYHSPKKEKRNDGHLRYSTCINDVSIDVLVSEILTRLPAKCVGRAKAVCKQWLSLLSTQDFVKEHCLHISTAYDQKSLVIGKESVYVLHVVADEYQASLSHKIVSLPFKASLRDVKILTTFNGLVCLCLRNTRELLIWNPLTNVYKRVYNSRYHGLFRHRCDVVAMYLDDIGDYRLLHVKHRHGILSVYTYSLNFDVWDKIGYLIEDESNMEDVKWFNGTFYKGVIYFAVRRWWFKKDGHWLYYSRWTHNLLVGFDVKLGNIRQISFPNIKDCQGYGHLVVVRNELHMFVTQGEGSTIVDLWRMEDQGWTKIWVFPHIRPILIGYNISYVLSTGKYIMVANSGSANELDITRNGKDCYYPLVSFNGLQGVVYTETLVSPNS